MGNSVDSRAVEAQGCTKTTRGLGINQVAPSDGRVDQATNTRSVGNTTRSILPPGPYRKTRGDFPYIRIVVTTAIIAGLLISTAPAAFAQVGTLISRDPTTTTLDHPARDVMYTDNVVPPDNGATRQSDIHHLRLSISWDGTSKALRCSYELLIEGNTRRC